MLIKQEIHCHECNKYVRFEVDIDQDGNYTIPCPNCGHEHYRVIRNKRITDQRWKSSGGGVMNTMPQITVTWATTSNYSIDSGSLTNNNGYYYIGHTSTSYALAY